ncbi:GNAT family N-acetyltransferase [Aeromonas caviae]|uniref:hypothetical protein n=1 Tax=Aeromonas caviae TaxID=648 RepID=UPI003977BC4D
MFKLETKRLILRDMRLSDENAFVAMSQDNKYQRFYSESDCDSDKYRQLTTTYRTPTLLSKALDSQNTKDGCLRF